MARHTTFVGAAGRQAAASLAGALLVGGCTAAAPPEGARGEVETQTNSVVYDTDDRLEPYEITNPTLSARLLQSSVMLLRGGVLDNTNPAAPRLSAPSLAEVDNVCPEEPFANQPALGDCSGTLVAPALVLLAAHCIPGGCPPEAFVLAPAYEGPGQAAPMGPGDVRRCAEVVLLRTVDDLDVAIVALDSPFERGVAVPTRPLGEPLQVGEAVTLLGFPRGVPAKAAPGAVLGIEGNRFSTNVDAFEGNSGGGIFDGQGRLVGHLSKGNADFVRAGDCNVSQVLPGDGSQRAEQAVLWSSTLTVACQTRRDLFDCDGVSGSLPAPAGWSCDANRYDDGMVCDCTCGLRDPDCDDPAAVRLDCPSGYTCTAEGSCVIGDEDPVGAGGEDAPVSDGGCFASAASVAPLGGLLGLWGGWRRRRRRGETAAKA